MAGSEAELFFFAVTEKEDLMVLAETVYEAEKDVWGRTHRREDSRSAAQVKETRGRELPVTSVQLPVSDQSPNPNDQIG